MSSEILSLILRARDEASAEVGKVHKALGKLGGAAHGLGGPLRVAKGAVGGLVDSLFSMGGLLAGGGIIAGLSAAANAAADDAASVAKLDTIIKANAKTQGDYTAALDKTISAGQKLAFSDDETRASLGRLITSTKDVEEATRLNALAMDFARLKGIPLADAANIIGKVHDGNVGILSRYGITVAKGASVTEALAQVQAAAGGQAETYAASSKGAMDMLQDGFSEAGESIGTLVLPAMQALVKFATESILPAISGIVGAMSTWIGDNQTLISGIGTFVTGALADLGTIVREQIIPAVQGIAEKFGALVSVVVELVIPTILDLVKRVWEGGLNKVVDAGAKLIGSVIEVLTDLYTAIYTNEAIMDGLRTAADLIGAAFGFVADMVVGALDFLGDLGDWITGNETIMGILRTLADGIGTAFKLAGDAISGALGFLRDLVKFARDNLDVLNLLGEIDTSVRNAPITIGPGPRQPGGDVYVPGGGIPGYAGGGWVGLHGPEIVRVGERGPEYVTPNNRLGGGTINLNVTVQGAALFDPYGQAAQQIAAALLPGLQREVRRQGTSF